jgi:LPS export ABC transporter protein LptC
MNHKEIERWHRLKNLKKAAQFLVVIAVLFLVAGYAVSRFVNKKPDDFPSPAVSETGIRIENFSYSAPGAYPWELKAASATVSDSLERVELKDPQVTYLGRAGEDIVLSAQHGKLDRKSSNFSAEGDVTIAYRDFLFSTSRIEYSEKDRVAHTDSPVSLKSPDLVITGRGLRLSVSTKEICIEDQVKAILYNLKLLGPGQKLPL